MKDTLPESLLNKIFDASGSPSGGNQGFMLFYINAEGDPVMTCRFENGAVTLALQKVLEMQVEQDYPTPQ